MARVLYCWEIGDGLGYAEGLSAFARYIRTLGYDVAVAFRNLVHAERLLGADIRLYQAPIRLFQVGKPIARPATFADLLYNVGFGEPEALVGQARAWRSLFDAFEPDVLRCLHSPSALLAARGLGLPTITIGTGFLLPPPVTPLPYLRGWEQAPKDADAGGRERLVLDSMNEALKTLGAPKLDYLAQLYETERQEIFSFPELDEYPQRKNGSYLGLFQIRMPYEPQWPAAGTKRLYAHLELSQALPGILQALKQSGCAVVAFVPHAPEELRKRFTGDNFVFTGKPLDLIETAKQCDLSVNQGGHNIAATVLLAGKPQLLVPFTLPERIAAENVMKMGAGLVSNPAPDAVSKNLKTLLAGPSFVEKAQAFAKRHSDYTVDGWKDKVRDNVESLAKQGSKRPVH